MTAANHVGGLPDGGAGTLLPGERYTLADRIGGGASGDTYAAVDGETGRACAVKLFRADQAAAAAVIEFRRLQALSHPNIVRVHDVGLTADRRVYLVMDRVAGPPLSAIAGQEDTARRRTAFERAARDLADALAYLHGREIVHADIAPANVRLGDDGAAVLFDFGLALAAGGAAPGPLNAAGGARGTLGYAAPEALVGRCSAASDLFALGATLFQAWTGAPPFGTGVEAVQRMLSSRAPVLSSVRDGLGPAWDDLFARLLDPQPERRPSNARELLREVMRLQSGGDAPIEIELRAPYPGGDPLAGIVVGRDAEHQELRLCIEQLAEGAAGRSVVAIAGVVGSGRRTVIDLAVRDALIARAASLLPPFVLWRGPDLPALRRFAEGDRGPNFTPAPPVVAVEENHRADREYAWLADALERHAASHPLCVVLEGDDPQALAFAAFLAGAEPSGRLLLVLPALSTAASASALGPGPGPGPGQGQGIDRRFARTLMLGPLGAEAVGQLIRRAAGEPAPAAAIAALSRASGGHAALVVALARRLVDALRRGDADAFAAELQRDTAPDLRRLLQASFESLERPARRLIAAAILFDGDTAAAGLDADATAQAEEQARRAGWWAAREASPGQLPGHLSGSLAVEVALAALSDPALRDLAARAAASLPATNVKRAGALAALGDKTSAAEVLRDAARAAEPAAAAPLLERAAALAPAVMTLADHLVLVTGWGVLGRYDDALALLDRLPPATRSLADAATLAERRAWLLGRRGDVPGARAVLEQALLAMVPDGSGTAAPAEGLLRARLARLLVTMGQLPGALSAAAPVLARGTADPNYPAAAEAALLAHAYAGEDEPARALHRTLSEAAVAASGRLTYLGALIDQLAGRLQSAVPQYRRALELTAASHDVHTLAAVALNLGALLAEQGLYGEALTALERAIRELGRLGSTAELGTALLNAANLFVVLGEVGSARRLLGRARDEAATRGAPAVEAFACFVEADLERRRGQPRSAAALYRTAALGLRQHGQPAAAQSALYSEVEALGQAGQLADASSALAALCAAPANGGSPAIEDAELLRAAARLILAGAPLDASVCPSQPSQVAQSLHRLAALAADEGRRPSAWRSALAAARLFQRENNLPAAREDLTRARRLFQEIQMATPEPYRPSLASDPDVPWLGEAAAAASGDAAAALRAAFTENRLRRLLRINKRLNSELRLPRLLETIIDTVIELTDAERGFILLEDEDGELAVRVARNIDQRTLEAPELALSRSIARQAAAGGEPIVTIDAAGDDRFKEAVSVSDLHLRSVLAVPLVIKGRSAGTIYVDHRLRKGAFDQDDVNLVTDFAEQAAIALENARLLSQLRRRERQVEALNRRLEVELTARREEMTGMKQELLQNREALAIRYDYRNIVGRTPRMLDLFRLLDRITDTTLPVVIQGESGTGKELVARALHFNGPRRQQTFVSESCAAIPETLLESTLFGYARGAFTGADHDTRGLFEVADGGTLFLDEIGEMSPAMQGKLLRVLQEGEFRRVGGERTRKVDVRIVAATNRDLARMVEEGKFRQDLYFRLSVARIFLPPLRERREDIPLIVEHLLAKHGAGAPRKVIEPAVLNSLLAYRWPGNVRELENEIMRAVALSGERITLADLSPAVAAQGDGTAAAPDDPDSLQLRPRVERLERSLLREALGRFDNNQTKAADALGLSRFGLQKKLKRYRFA